jgi:hypothetical protein
MPSDPGAGSIFVDTDLSKVLNRMSSELGDFYEERLKEPRGAVGQLQSSPGVIVTKAKGSNAPVSEMAMKFEGLQRQIAERGYQGMFFRFADQRGLIAKAGYWRARRRVCVRKQRLLI